MKISHYLHGNPVSATCQIGKSTTIAGGVVLTKVKLVGRLVQASCIFRNRKGDR